MRIIFLLLMLLIVTPAWADAQEGESYAVSVNSASLRRCPRSSCEIVVRLPRDTLIVVLEVVTGSRRNGSTIWYRTNVDGDEGYIHSSQVMPLGDTTVACPSRRLKCSELLTCEAAYACLAAGNRRLDRDRDGVPCENLCPGG